MILFLILSFLEFCAERRRKSIYVELNFAMVFAFSLMDTIPNQFAYVLLLKQICDTVNILGRMYPDSNIFRTRCIGDAVEEDRKF